MAFKDTTIFKNLINEGELPTIPVETYVDTGTLVKSGLIICAIVVITVLLIRITKPEPATK